MVRYLMFYHSGFDATLKQCTCKQKQLRVRWLNGFGWCWCWRWCWSDLHSAAPCSPPSVSCRRSKNVSSEPLGRSSGPPAPVGGSTHILCVYMTSNLQPSSRVTEDRKACEHFLLPWTRFCGCGTSSVRYSPGPQTESCRNKQIAASSGISHDT